jgi:hypothetical protein
VEEQWVTNTEERVSMYNLVLSLDLSVVSLLVDEIGRVRKSLKITKTLLTIHIGFSPDPVLTGVAIGETVKGIQDAGVIANAKHYIMNEQEHNREPSSQFAAYSANVDDKTMHETYLWYLLSLLAHRYLC